MFKIKEEDVENTRLQYYREIVDELPKEISSAVLWAFLMYPNTEKIYKSEIKQVLLNALKYNWCTLPEYFKGTFDIDIKAKTKNIYTLFGVNKYQLQRWAATINTNDNSNEIRNVKYALNTNNISSFTNEIFDKIFDFLIKNRGTSAYYSEEFSRTLGTIVELYSMKSMLNVIDSANALLDSKQITIWDLCTYNDYIVMVKKLDDTRNFRPNFNTKDDIKEMHEAALSIYNVKQESYKAEAFQNSIKKIEKYQFDDEAFTVVIPQRPNDLAAEGLELHHCVKSYIDKVCNNKTNICFIRKTDELNKPFFTVEITNDGSIQQVHGFANRNASTEPGLTEFVKKWAKERKLKLTNFNKVR
jgi:hypothetical protein